MYYSCLFQLGKHQVTICSFLTIFLSSSFNATYAVLILVCRYMVYHFGVTFMFQVLNSSGETSSYPLIFCSFQGSPCEDRNFRSDVDDTETEEASISGQEDINDLLDILEWAKVCSFRCIQGCFFFFPCLLWCFHCSDDLVLISR